MIMLHVQQLVNYVLTFVYNNANAFVAFPFSNFHSLSDSIITFPVELQCIICVFAPKHIAHEQKHIESRTQVSQQPIESRANTFKGEALTKNVHCRSTHFHFDPYSCLRVCVKQKKVTDFHNWQTRKSPSKLA